MNPSLCDVFVGPPGNAIFENVTKIGLFIQKRFWRNDDSTNVKPVKINA